MRRLLRSLTRLQHYNVTPVCGEDGPLLFDSCHSCCTLCTKDRVRGLCLRVLLALPFDGILWGDVLFCQHNKKQRAAYIVGPLFTGGVWSEPSGGLLANTTTVTAIKQNHLCHNTR